MELKNKVVLITGASKGIGKAAAIAFAKEGCSVVINFKSDTKAAEGTLNECDKYSQGNFIAQADISKENEIAGLFQKIKKKISHLDILVNNAGIFDENDSPTNIASFEKIYRNNFLSAIMVTKYALEILKEGKIVNISSVHGRLGGGRPEAAAYSAFKAALENYTKNLAKQVAPKILVNAVAPGPTLTPMWGNMSPKEQKEISKNHLVQRMIKPDEIADGIIFLAKNDAVCGEILTIDGGSA
ncbi:MAG: SDR family oxidoreductase [Patescibacteria group bacterium]|nr:SDR family oxidoreductase [Patescibacteria group bacterium]MDE1945595.1 SDR family oxidoreductase [Patescibacteria group bacterium]